jgi:transposase
MYLHANAKLGLAGRFALVQAIEEGMSLKAAAAAFSVSPATAHRWWHRWLEAGEGARRTLSCLFDRSSRPRRSPRQLAVELEEAICACRRQTGWGPRLVAGATGFAHSTVWKVLRRAGISRPPKPAKGPANRYEWPCPGDPCCTWTQAATHASCGPATASPATAPSPCAVGASRRGSAMTTRTRSSTWNAPGFVDS